MTARTKGLVVGIAAAAAIVGGLAVAGVFSGGIGEHAPVVRTRICDGLAFLGVAIDSDRNGANVPVISAAASRAAVYVIPTDEEVMIARAAYRVLAKDSV